MANPVLDNFLHSLATFIVAQAAALSPPVTLAYQATPRALWRNLAREADAADPYSTLRFYGGPPWNRYHPLLRQSVQVQTIGTDDVAALQRSWALFQTLQDAAGRPLRMTVIPGTVADSSTANGTWMIVSVDALQRPGSTSRDDRGRSVVTWNFEIAFYKAS